MVSNRHRQAGKLGIGGKILIAVAVGAIGFGAVYYVQRMRPAGQAASVAQIQGVTEDTDREAQAPVGNAAVALPTASLSQASTSCTVSVLTIPWNATMGLMYANGGRQTTAKSLMETNHVRVNLIRQDDYSKMQEQQLKFAQEFKGGTACPSSGAAFTVIMGDGYSAYAAGIQAQIAKLGQSVEVIGAIGKSHGEDACMLPQEVATDPQQAKGKLVGAVIRDGDYNICVAWAAQNQIPINPDEKTWDPDALNFRATDSFAEADEGYIAGTCEDRPIVKAGKRTGEVKHVCQDGTATWTPGDVNVAMKKGGLAKVASSADFGNQMAAVIIGNKQFDAANPKLVQALLKASFQGADAVRSSDDALLLAGAVESKVYGEQKPSYWAKYFKGSTEKDATGQSIHLGGSRVMDAADNAYYFGIGGSGGDDIYQHVYKLFGDHYVKYYPSVMSSYPDYGTVVNLSYLREVVNDTGVTADSAEDKPVFTADQKVDHTVSKGNYSIEFDTGKASIKPESEDTLKELLSQLISTTLAVQITGNTDNTGNAKNNIALSIARANAVRAYFVSNAPGSFDKNRVATTGLGQSNPIADNSTSEGRAKNRRVEIVLNSVGN